MTGGDITRDRPVTSDRCDAIDKPSWRARTSISEISARRRKRQAGGNPGRSRPEPNAREDVARAPRRVHDRRLHLRPARPRAPHEPVLRSRPRFRYVTSLGWASGLRLHGGGSTRRTRKRYTPQPQEVREIWSTSRAYRSRSSVVRGIHTRQRCVVKSRFTSDRCADSSPRASTSGTGRASATVRW